VLLASAVSAQEWTETADAPSFPDGAAQVTRGDDGLTSIVGTTGAGDPRDAYCIEISDPAGFLATTDPVTDPGASGTFDTRLLLFDESGAAVLANDDTLPSTSPFLSTLTGTATDGSGFVLSQPGRYLLVVAGLPDEPVDGAATGLFDFGSGSDLVHARNPAAGRFHAWEGGTPAVGAYTVVLRGADTCQTALDAVSASGGHNEICRGDGMGRFPSCSPVSPESGGSEGVALGYVDGDAHLDAVFANLSGPNHVCLGDGEGGFTSCADIATGGAGSAGVALGFVDGDQHPDALFAALSGPSQVCSGDGAGGFAPCTFVDANAVSDVALGFVDADAHLDAVFSRVTGGEAVVCLGDGAGFSCDSFLVALDFMHAVALGFVDGDAHLDAVFGLNSEPDRVCLGDGEGGFSCADVDARPSQSLDVTLGFVDGDASLDAVFATNAGHRICLGDGAGGFSCADGGETALTSGVALGLVDADDHLDAVFSDGVDRNEVCLGDGAGGFPSCVLFGMIGSQGIALGELGALGPDIFADGFESGDTSAWSTSSP
jgi:hypothetical protein